MQQNILRDSNITSIFIQYVDNGTRNKFAVRLRFMDRKECFFAAELPANFVKPKKKILADLSVYTVDGVYKTTVKLLDTTVSIQELLFETEIPKTWNFIQMRRSSRKNIELPVHIKFNDGFSIDAKSYDLALGGISFYAKENLSSIYRKISGILSVELPKDLIISLPENKLTVEAKFIREITKRDEYSSSNEFLYVFKFMSLTAEQQVVLTNFLIRLV